MVEQLNMNDVDFKKLIDNMSAHTTTASLCRGSDYFKEFFTDDTTDGTKYLPVLENYTLIYE